MPQGYELDRLYEAKRAARAELNSLHRRYDSQISSLRAEHDQLFERSQATSRDITNAFDRGDREEGYRLIAENRTVQADMKALPPQWRPMTSEIKAAKARYEQLKVDIEQAKRRDEDGQPEDDDRSLAEWAGISSDYWDEMLVSREADGTTNLYFGGDGSPDGPGCGLYILNAEGELVDAWEPEPEPELGQSPGSKEHPYFDSQYHDDGRAAKLTKGGDRSWETPVHAADAESRDVTVSFGREGTKHEDQTLIADGHLTSEEFYGKDAQGDNNHDHSHPSDPRHGGYEDRGKYSGN